MNMTLYARRSLIAGSIAMGACFGGAQTAFASPISFPGQISWDVSRSSAPGFLETYGGDLWSIVPLGRGDTLASYEVVNDPLSVTPLSVSMSWRASSWLGSGGRIEHEDTTGGFSLSEFRGDHHQWRQWQVDLTNNQILADVFIQHSFVDELAYSQIPVMTLSNARLDPNLGWQSFDLSLTAQAASFLGFQAGQSFGTLTIATVPMTSVVPEPSMVLLLAGGLFMMHGAAARRRSAMRVGRAASA